MAVVYYHGSCFDGLASAALATWLRERLAPQDPVLNWVPVSYVDRLSWLRPLSGAPAIVVDFLYHGQAEWWWDHHATTFVDSILEEHARRRASPFIRYAPEQPSAAVTILAATAGLVEWPAHLRELTTWATKTDSADFTSPEETLQAVAPGLRIWLAIQAPHEAADETAIISAMKEGGIAAPLTIPAINALESHARELQWEGQRRIEIAMSDTGPKVALFRVSDEGCIVNRYAPFALRPELEYYVGVFENSTGVHLRAMRNPWRDAGRTHLGAVAKEYGGGGHPRIGSIAFGAHDAERASAIARTIAARLAEANACSVA